MRDEFELRLQGEIADPARRLDEACIRAEMKMGATRAEAESLLNGAVRSERIHRTALAPNLPHQYPTSILFASIFLSERLMLARRSWPWVSRFPAVCGEGRALNFCDRVTSAAFNQSPPGAVFPTRRAGYF